MFEISSNKKGFVFRNIYFIKGKICWIGKSFVRGNRGDYFAGSLYIIKKFLDHVF